MRARISGYNSRANLFGENLMPISKKDNLFLGFLRHIIPVPSHIWHKQIEKTAGQHEDELAFMTKEHHLVRNYVVREMPHIRQPISPSIISKALALPEEQLIPILTDLERHMTFLFRNPQGDVTWAYPVTVDTTPHRVTFSSGEQIYAA